MKKILAGFPVLLFIFICFCTSASAETLICNLGSAEAGSEISCPIAVVPNDALLVPGVLPEGCGISAQTRGESLHLVLTGKPMNAGSFRFSIGAGDDVYDCSISFYPSLPRISSSAGVNCYVGDAAQISVSACVGDAGSLSYQWYLSPSNGSVNGAPLPGAVSAVYSPDTSNTSSAYYYCDVTNTNNGLISLNSSLPISVSVTEPDVSSIAVETLPAKLAYQVGEALDLSGLTIKVSYLNGSQELISSGYSSTPAAFSAEGQQTVTLAYMGKTCSFTVDVTRPAETVEGIGVVTLPDKKDYTVGDTLQSAGLSIRVYTDQGHYDVSAGLACTPSVFAKAGSQTVTVSYMGKTCSFTLDIKEAAKPEPLSITVTRLPTKTSYFVGDVLESTGMVLRLTKDDGAEEELRYGFSCEPKALTKAGIQEITVSYGGKSAVFNVTVAEKVESTPAASASPTPAVSPKPGESGESTAPLPSASNAPEPVSRAQRSAKLTQTLLRIVLVAAVVGISALGGYVYFRKRSGRR